ncbi:hypothetical protein ACJIZ3_002700 [Penstemon smallii]|uniref:Reverse transcriptase Ty1/copia-type domain-containing protein n=1 Tax=Penstemon smallii TaxID=265156 RepID=A0ABD3U750_9LAMI
MSLFWKHLLGVRKLVVIVAILLCQTLLYQIQREKYFKQITTLNLSLEFIQEKGFTNVVLPQLFLQQMFNPMFRVMVLTLKEALDDLNWRLAMMEEMNALRKNNTWSVIDLPKNKKTVGSKWVFTVKCKADGSVEIYKARLVAKGFTQTHGIDYQETFAPVAKINSIRILLSLTVISNWPLHQFDVKNAFLNGDLQEEVFMDLPPGFENRFGRGKVCKLKKALYGLKQSPRAWFERFGNVIRRHGFSQSQADHTLFFKHST